LGVLKKQISTFWIADDDLTILYLDAFLWRKIKQSFGFCFYARNDSENPSINPLHVACFRLSGRRLWACGYKSYSESRL
jgi:hypothetical protein